MTTRSALVTGASRGIGLGIALRLAERGFGLTVTSRHASDLEVVRRRLLSAGAPSVHSVAADLADPRLLSEVVDVHARAFGSMQGLVLNAGVGTAGPLDTFPLRRLEKTFAVNFQSAMVLLQRALPLLRSGANEDARHGAKVVGVSSITGAFPTAGLGVYGASKAALTSLLTSLSLEEAPNGVSATAVAPGYVATDMSAWVSDAIAPEQMIQVDDVVAIVCAIFDLSRHAVLAPTVLTRAAARGYEP